MDIPAITNLQEPPSDILTPPINNGSVDAHRRVVDDSIDAIVEPPIPPTSPDDAGVETFPSQPAPQDTNPVPEREISGIRCSDRVRMPRTIFSAKMSGKSHDSNPM